MILRWSQKQGHIATVPEIEQIPSPRREVTIPTPDEVVSLLDQLPDRIRPIVHFIAETGCRLGEVRNLTWSSIDELRGTVHIRPYDGWTPKTRQSERRVFIGGELLETIRRLPKASRYVFPGKDPTRPFDNFKKALASAVKRAGIERDSVPLKITPHVLRKAYATWQAEKGVPSSTLQSLLGHAPGSRTTERHYVHITDEARRGAVIQLPTQGSGQISRTHLAKSGNT